jgi:hypothetical protein
VTLAVMCCGMPAGKLVGDGGTFSSRLFIDDLENYAWMISAENHTG